MKKLLVVIIISFLIIGLNLNAKTNERNATRSIIELGTGVVAGFDIPINTQNEDSMVEVVYLQEWLNAEMTIHTVSFRALWSVPMPDPLALKIYMGTTAQDDLTAGWITGAGMQEVFSGTIQVPAVNGWYDIPLGSNFVYDNVDNLVMLIISNGYEPTWDAWYRTDSGTPNRTRYNYGTDPGGPSWAFDAIDGPWTGIETTSNYPDVRFQYIPEPGTLPPAEATGVTFVVDAGGALETQIDWTCPTLDNEGYTLLELLEMRVYRGESLIHTDTSPSIGGSGSYLDTSVPSSGLYEYHVVGYNSFGESIPVDSGELWVGEDMPGAVTGLTLTDVSTEDLIAQLDWINPTIGSHGGYLAGVTGYDIVRSDEAIFNLSGSATTWQDDSITEAGMYDYTVTPYNDLGPGLSTTSSATAIGIPVIQVGVGEMLYHQLPIVWNYADTMTETVFLQEWLDAGMAISAVSYHASMVSTMTNPRDLEIWMGTTTQDDLAAGWITGASLEQVFSGTILVAPGDYWVSIPLDETYIYENVDNLVMLIITNDDENLPSGNYWWASNDATSTRSRVAFTNNYTAWGFNALTGPWTSDQVRAVYPDVRFFYTPLGDYYTPGEATDVTFIANPGGELATQIDWTCPSLTYGGETLTELLEMRVYRNESLIYTDTSPSIGISGSYLDASVPSSGFNEYKVVGYNSHGEGFPVYGSPWVGEDIPGAVDNLVLTQTSPDALSGTLTWDNPTTGSHGGPFNEPILGYHIERNDEIIFEPSGSATSYIDGTLPTSAYYCYTVVPYNVIGDGPGVTSDLVSIGDADLVILENFSNSVPPTGWYVDGLGLTNWSSNPYAFAGGTAPELEFDWTPYFIGTSRMCSNTLDTSGMSTLALEFKHSSSHYEDVDLLPYSFGVATSSDGITWHDAWTVIPTGNIVHETVNVDITNADVGSATFQICFYFDGESYFRKWWIDDVLLTASESLVLLPPENVIIEIIGNDVAITWDEVTGASSYIVYSSNDPYNGFSEDLSGSFLGESWNTPIVNEKKFYYVTATN